MSIILTSNELDGVTGYRTPKRQLAELHRQGFYRARISATGNVILERAHHPGADGGLHSEQESAQVHGN